MRHPRCRAVMKWTGACFSVMIALILVTSTWAGISVGYEPSRGGDLHVVAAHGNVQVGYDPDVGPTSPPAGLYGPFIQWERPGWDWNGLYWAGGAKRKRGRSWAVGTPIYVPLAPIAISTIVLFFRDRRRVRWRREGRCVGCGYDLSGVSGTCPECGREAA
jgi:hypothetical protein